MEEQKWFYLVTPYSSLIGLVLVIWQLFNDSLVLAEAILVISIFNCVAYTLHIAHRRYGESFVPDLCLFCWLFIAVINVMRLFGAL